MEKIKIGRLKVKQIECALGMSILWDKLSSLNLGQSEVDKFKTTVEKKFGFEFNEPIEMIFQVRCGGVRYKDKTLVSETLIRVVGLIYIKQHFGEIYTLIVQPTNIEEYRMSGEYKTYVHLSVLLHIKPMNISDDRIELHKDMVNEINEIRNKLGRIEMRARQLGGANWLDILEDVNEKLTECEDEFMELKI